MSVTLAPMSVTRVLVEGRGVRRCGDGGADDVGVGARAGVVEAELVRDVDRPNRAVWMRGAPIQRRGKLVITAEQSSDLQTLLWSNSVTRCTMTGIMVCKQSLLSSLN